MTTNTLFIDAVMNKKAEIVRVYLPPDGNCLLSVMDHCLRSRHYVNVVIAGKHPAPQWLTMDAAVKHCIAGLGIWQWASSDLGVAPDVVMACCGDVPTLETLAAVSILREHLPDLKVRVVNVIDLMKLQPDTAAAAVEQGSDHPLARPSCAGRRTSPSRHRPDSKAWTAWAHAPRPPAELTQADVGFAIGAGTDVAMDSARCC